MKTVNFLADERQSAAKRTLFDFPRLGTISTDFYVAKPTELLAGQSMNDLKKKKKLATK